TAGPCCCRASQGARHSGSRRRRATEAWTLDHLENLSTITYPLALSQEGERVFEARLATDDALPGHLVKLLEGDQKLLPAGNKTSQAEEIVDLLEVVREIATQAGIRGRGYPSRRTQAATQRRI